MIDYAKFVDEKSAAQFVAQIDAAYGWPSAETTTYATPQRCKDGTYIVKLKPWLKADIGQSRKWCKPAAISFCAAIPANDITTTQPDLDVAVSVLAER